MQILVILIALFLLLSFLSGSFYLAYKRILSWNEELVKNFNALQGSASGAANTAQSGVQTTKAISKESYNTMVKEFNILLEIFPFSFLAKKFNIQKKELMP